MTNGQINPISYKNLTKMNSVKMARKFFQIFKIQIFNPWQDRGMMLMALTNWYSRNGLLIGDAPVDNTGKKDATKGRKPKFTAKQVWHMFDLSRDHKDSEIAHIYDVNQSVIKNILDMKSYEWAFEFFYSEDEFEAENNWIAQMA